MLSYQSSKPLLSEMALQHSLHIPKKDTTPCVPVTCAELILRVYRETHAPNHEGYNEDSSTIKLDHVLYHACPLQAWILLEEMCPQELDVESQTPEKLICTVVLVKIFANPTRVSRATNRFHQLAQYR